MRSSILELFTPQPAERSAGVLNCFSANIQLMKTFLLIDGENFKGMIKDVIYFEGSPVKDFPWHTFDFAGLFAKVLKGIDIDETYFYFAKIKKHEKTKEKSEKLIQQQRLLKTHLERQGFNVELSGNVRGNSQITTDGKEIIVFREKGVDVKIAVDMVVSACDKVVKRIVLGSSDSDLQPAIREITENRGIECIYLGFEISQNKGISFTSNRTILIRNSEVMECKEIQARIEM